MKHEGNKEKIHLKTPYSLVEVDRCFRGAYFPHQNDGGSTRYTPESCHVHTRCSEGLKSHTEYTLTQQLIRCDSWYTISALVITGYLKEFFMYLFRTGCSVLWSTRRQSSSTIINTDLSIPPFVCSPC
jgi:hypothetical protein